jgi:hypothetical protein
MALTTLQKSIIKRMREGEKLTLHFPMSVGAPRYQLNKNPILKSSIESLKYSGYVKHDGGYYGGLTIHYYVLTELGCICKI